MAVTTGITLNASLSGIVDDIRMRSYDYLGKTGVCKKLVTAIGVGSSGSSVTEPYFDPTGESVGTASEGVDYTTFATYVPTKRTYTATESIKATFITDENVEDSRESYRDDQAIMHSYVHAKALELQITACFASFTSQINATATGGLTIAKLALAKATLRDKVQEFSGPYNYVGDEAANLQLFNTLTSVSNVGVLGSLGDSLLDKYHTNTLLGDINCYTSGHWNVTATSYHITGLFTKQAIGLWVPRDFRMKTQENISLRATELVSTMRSGARVRLAPAGVGIKVAKTLA